MGLFDKFKKKEKDEKVLKQDLSKKDENNQVFMDIFKKCVIAKLL